MPLPNWMVYTLYGNAMLDLTIFISPGSIAVPDLIEAKFKSPEGELKDLHCDMDFLEVVEEKAKQRYFLMVFIQVTGSQFRAHPPLVWYPPYPQKKPSHRLPYACYLQHVGATTFDLQPVCSI